MPPSSPSVLLIRLDGIGDALALAPLVAALRERNVPVDGVFSEVNLNAFAPSALRERWIAPFSMRDGSPSNLDAIAGFGATLGKRGYSHVLVATEDPGGYRLAWATNAPNRIGFANGWGKPLKTLWVRSLLTQTLYRAASLDKRGLHECEVMFELGRMLVGRDAAPARNLEILKPLVVEGSLQRDERIGFQVTDKWDRLNIAFDEVTAAASAVERSRLRAFGSSRESQYIERFEQATGIVVKRFDDVAQWKGAIAGSGALIAPDGGAIHVAGMTGTPTVAVFPPGRDAGLQMGRWAPWAAQSVFVEAHDHWSDAIAAATRYVTSGSPRSH